MFCFLTKASGDHRVDALRYTPGVRWPHHTLVMVLTLAKLLLSQPQKRIPNKAEAASYGPDARSGLLTAYVAQGKNGVLVFEGSGNPF